MFQYHNFKSHRFTVLSIKEIVPGVRTITFATPSTLHPQPFSYKPGQFLFVKFLSDRVTGEWHPFTISSSPTEDHIAITPKASGDWTHTLDDLLPGDSALIKAPYGDFTCTNVPNAKGYVFIIGGIGVTPFRSMLKYLRDTKSTIPVQIIYANKRQAEVAFRDEIDQYPTTHIMSRDPGWTGETGHVDAACIKKHIKDISVQDYFVCGPPPMMDLVKKSLVELGVPASQIRSERFALK